VSSEEVNMLGVPNETKIYRMYDDFAELWPMISKPEDYAFESQFWREALREKLGPGRHHILELGVGGGDNLSHLTNDFQATAVDLSEKMLAISKRQNQTVEHIVGDMRNIRLGRKFKAVIIHDAISYLNTEDELLATFETAAEHLEPGGVFITAPEWYRETYQKTTISHSTKNRNGTELTFIQYENDPDPTDTKMHCWMIYLIRENGSMHIEKDLHITGIFPIGTWIDLLTRSGFSVEKWPYPIYEDNRKSYLFVSTWTGNKLTML
jgi:hypothetical protein